MQGKSLAWTLEHTKHSTNDSHVISIHIFVIINYHCGIRLIGLEVVSVFKVPCDSRDQMKETLEASAILGGRTGGGVTVGFRIINPGDQNPSSTLS